MIAFKIAEFLGIQATFEVDNDPYGLTSSLKLQAPNNRIVSDFGEGAINLHVYIKIHKDDKIEHDLINQNSMKNNTVKNDLKDLKDFFHDQSGTHIKVSEEKSMKLKMTESSKSNLDNEDDEDDEDTDGLCIFTQDTHLEKNIGIVREFNTLTKENRDSIQESSKRGEDSQDSSNLGKINKGDRLRQNLDNYVEKKDSDEPNFTKDSVCVEGAPTQKVNSLNFISASNNKNFQLKLE